MCLNLCNFLNFRDILNLQICIFQRLAVMETELSKYRIMPADISIFQTNGIDMSNILFCDFLFLLVRAGENVGWCYLRNVSCLHTPMTRTIIHCTIHTTDFNCTQRSDLRNAQNHIFYSLYFIYYCICRVIRLIVDVSEKDSMQRKHSLIRTFS